MYKRVKGKKFSRKTDQRRAFMKALAVNLVMQEKIRTTKVRARQAASMVEKLITKAKKGDLASRRALAGILNPAAAEKLVKSIAPRFKDRAGGYTRVIKIGPRVADGAPMALAELLDRPVEKSSVAPESGKETKKKNKAEKSKKEKTAKPKKEEK